MTKTHAHTESDKLLVLLVHADVSHGVHVSVLPLTISAETQSVLVKLRSLKMLLHIVRKGLKREKKWERVEKKINQT